MKTPDVALFIETSRSYGRGLCLGVADYAKAHGDWNFLIHERDLRSGLPKWLETWKGDGILCRLTNPELADFFAKAPYPVIDLYGQIRHPDIPYLDTDAAAVAEMAARFFINATFTNLAYCGFPGLWFSDDRCNAFQNATKRFGITLNIYQPPFDRQGTDVASRESLHPEGSSELAEWIKSLPARTAILACNDIRAQQLVKAASHIGRRIPDDLAVMGVDDDRLICELCNPRLTSIRPDTRTLGYTAAHWLHLLINGKKLPYHHLFVPPLQITERASSDTIASEDAVLVKALRYIRNHAHQRMGANDVVRHTGLSRSTLEARFRQQIGTSIKSHITQARLNRSAILLRETEMNLAEVANACGFATASHFLRLFKKDYQQTPGQYRDSFKNRKHTTAT